MAGRRRSQREATAEAPIAVGSKGALRGVAFVVRGRLTLRHSSGATWSEWYATFADGRGGWIAPEEKVARVTFEAGLPALRALAVGEPAWPSFVVAEKGRARYESAEGALPFAPPLGESYAYADLVAGGRRVATLDYSEDPPRLFAGEIAPLAALRIRPPARSRKTPAERKAR